MATYVEEMLSTATLQLCASRSLPCVSVAVFLQENGNSTLLLGFLTSSSGFLLLASKSSTRTRGTGQAVGGSWRVWLCLCELL